MSPYADSTQHAADLAPGESQDTKQLMDLIEGAIGSTALHLVAEFGIADLFGEFPRSVQELAGESSTSPAGLLAVLRLLAGHGLFAETDAGLFALTGKGALLRSDHPRSVRSIARLHHFNSAFLTEAALGLRTGEPVPEKVLGQSFFDYVASHPDLGAVFDAAMADMSRNETEAIVDAYDFSGFHRIVDVGGGSGTLLASILRACPRATGVVLDQPRVAPHAQELRSQYGLGDRMEFTGGDFFDEVPGGGDIYILKSVIHDWPDERAVEILRTCRRAIPSHGRLLLFERMMVPDNQAGQTKSLNLLMFLALGGCERTEQDFERLVAAAGFRLNRAARVDSTIFAIEAVPVEFTG